MEVSKTQNERPAINALIDLANGLETTAQGHTVQISNLQGALSSEISSRTSADTLLGNRILAEETARESADNALEDAIGAEETARETAIASINNKLGNTFSAQNSVSDFAEYILSEIDDLQLSLDNFKFGVGASATVQGNNYYDGTVTYPNAYPNNSVSFVFASFVSGVDQRDLEVTISESTNNGFSYTVINRAATEATFTIGYLALGFTPIA